MPAIELTCALHLYKIEKCGLYIKRDLAPKVLSPSETFRLLKGWAIDSGIPLNETSTYTPNSSYLEAYCLGMEEYNGNYLIALWNKVPKTHGGVGHVNGTNTPSQTTVSVTPLGQEDIPGYPTFFWALPAKNRIVAIGIEDTQFGISQFKSYITGYLRFNSPYCVWNENNSDELKGYSETPYDPNANEEQIVNSELKPIFNMPVKKIDGEYEKIKKNCTKIYKVIKDIQVTNTLIGGNATGLEKLVSWFKNIDPIEKKNMRIQMPVNGLAESQVQDMIDEYEANSTKSEFDAGFQISGMSRTLWLHASKDTKKVKLNIDFISQGQPDLKKLIIQLDNHTNLVN